MIKGYQPILILVLQYCQALESRLDDQVTFMGALEKLALSSCVSETRIYHDRTIPREGARYGPPFSKIAAV